MCHDPRLMQGRETQEAPVSLPAGNRADTTGHDRHNAEGGGIRIAIWREQTHAAEQLYFVRNDSIFPLDNEKKEGFIKGLSIFHIYDTKVEGLIIRDAMNNEVCVTLQIMKDGDIKQNKGVTKFYLNPVKINGTWYMTLRDKKAEGVMKPY